MGRLIVAAATDGLQGRAARADTDVVSSATNQTCCRLVYVDRLYCKCYMCNTSSKDISVKYNRLVLVRFSRRHTMDRIIFTNARTRVSAHTHRHQHICALTSKICVP